MYISPLYIQNPQSKPWFWTWLSQPHEVIPHWPIESRMTTYGRFFPTASAAVLAEPRGCNAPGPRPWLRSGLRCGGWIGDWDFVILKHPQFRSSSLNVLLSSQKLATKNIQSVIIMWHDLRTCRYIYIYIYIWSKSVNFGELYKDFLLSLAAMPALSRRSKQKLVRNKYVGMIVKKLSAKLTATKTCEADEYNLQNFTNGKPPEKVCERFVHGMGTRPSWPGPGADPKT